jgi:hypothetical protein
MVGDNPTLASSTGILSPRHREETTPTLVNSLSSHDTVAGAYYYCLEPDAHVTITKTSCDPSTITSIAEWEEMLKDTANELLEGVPLDQPRITTILAPYFDNKCAGECLEMDKVSWQNCYL